MAYYDKWNWVIKWQMILFGTFPQGLFFMVWPPVLVKETFLAAAYKHIFHPFLFRFITTVLGGPFFCFSIKMATCIKKRSIKKYNDEWFNLLLGPNQHIYLPGSVSTLDFTGRCLFSCWSIRRQLSGKKDSDSLSCNFRFSPLAGCQRKMARGKCVNMAYGSLTLQPPYRLCWKPWNQK